MAAVSGVIPNVIGGVSQQPPEIRTLNTSTALLNVWDSPATGKSVRPHQDFVGEFGLALSSGKTVATHTIDRPDGQYIIIVHNGQVKVLNKGTGSLETVTAAANATSYITEDDAAKNIGFVTVADTTFVYNRSKTVAVTNSAEGSGLTGNTDDSVVRKNPNRYSTVWIKQTLGRQSYNTLYLNGSMFAQDYLTDSDIARTSIEALKLYTNTYTAGGSYYTDGVEGPLTTHDAGDSQYIIELDNEGDIFFGDDNFANEAMIVYNDRVSQFSDLALQDYDGRLVMIEAAIGEDADDWWVWWKDGAWQETYGWNAEETLDTTTMPMILVNNGDGTWDLQETTWPGRTVGDADSNPSPTFVGNTVNEMFLHKGRMMILSDENVVASQVNRFENFYRTTCQQLLDSDPFDIAAPNSSGAKLDKWVPFDKGLLISSEFKQFRLTGDSEGLWGPNTIDFEEENSYLFKGSVPPIKIGPNPLFLNDNDGAGFASFHEYQIDTTIGRKIALPITDQVPEYIPSGVYAIAGNPSENLAAVVSSAQRDMVWIYQYYFSDQGKVQSAWHKWNSRGDVHGVKMLGNDLAIVQVFNGELVATVVSFYENADQIFNNQSILLDFKTTGTSPTVLSPGVTRVTLPYDMVSADADSLVCVVATDNTGSLPAGRIYKASSVSGHTADFPADLTGNQYYIGFTYSFSWELCPIYVRDQNLVAIQDARLQLRKVKFRYNNSGPFTVTVTPPARDPVSKKFTGVQLGGPSAVLGSPTMEGGIFSVLAQGRGEDVVIVVTAETPWRVRFSSVEWHGSYRPKKKRT